MVVVNVDIGGGIQRYEFERTFTIGTYPNCGVVVPPAREPYTIMVFVLADRASVGEGSRKVPVMLDGRGVDLAVRQPLHAGSVLVVPGATVTFERVPTGQSDMDFEAATEFDREMEQQIAAEPPPRPQLDSTSVSMDAVRVRDADPVALVSRPPNSLGALESVLGLAFPADLYVHGYVSTRQGRASEHAVSSLSASLSTGSLSLGMGYIEDTRHKFLERYSVSWSRGRKRCEDALAAKFGAPTVVTSDRTSYRAYDNFLVDVRDDHDDAFELEWHARLPDWAVPCDPGLRAGWLSELVATLDACTERADLVRRLGDVAEAGVAVEDYGHEVSIELAPTIAAQELVLALGWSDIAWKRADGCDDVPYLLVRSRDERPHEPRIGRWRVSVKLDGHFPNGPELPHNRFMRAIVFADRVRCIGIGY